MPSKGVSGTVPPVGAVFDRLTVVSDITWIEKSRSMVWCRCVCGKVRATRVNGLRTGSIRSCGCKQRDSVKERNYRHGMAPRQGKTDEYETWGRMIDRCTSPAKRNRRYQGRGIKVCKRWRESFVNFYADMGPKPGPGYSIDRINNDGDYKLSNCRWATDFEQANNTSRTRWITFKGETRTLTEWARKVGIGVSAMHGRLRRRPVREALTMPVTKGRWHK